MSDIPQDPPILLSAALTLSQNQVLQVGDTTLLANPDRMPMWCDEIRVQSSYRGENANFYNPLFMTSWKMSLGKTPITNEFVPMGVMGQLMNTVQGTAQTPNLLNDGATRIPVYEMTWKLPRPLYIPAGEFIRTWAQCLPADYALSTNTISVRVTFACRSIMWNTPAPKRIPVPWCTAFLGAARANGSDYVQESKTTDLVNSLGAQLHVQRLTGVLRYRNALTDAAAIQAAYANAYCRDTLLQMRTSKGAIIIRDRTPLSHVFGSERSWDMGTKMSHKDYYIATLTENYSNLSDTGTIQTAIGLIGSREVVFE